MTTAIIIGVLVVAAIWGCARVLRNWYAKDIEENKTKRFSEWLAFRIARWRRRWPAPTPSPTPVEPVKPVDPEKPVEPVKPTAVWQRRLGRWHVLCGSCGEENSCRLAVKAIECKKCGLLIRRV
jgi:hypothetical protein